MSLLDEKRMLTLELQRTATDQMVPSIATHPTAVPHGLLLLDHPAHLRIEQELEAKTTKWMR